MTADSTKAPAQELSQSELTQQLAEFVATLTAEAVPDKLQGILSNALLDSIGCALFGLTTDTCGIIRGFTLAQGGPQESSVWGSGGKRVSAINAVLANGAAVHGFDFDDHSRAKIHPGAVVIPAALALAEAHGCEGQRFLTAIAAGYEVMNRISLATGPVASRLKGWHLTGTTGTFGAAAAAAIILGLDARQTAAAFGIAGTQSSGLWAFNADGATTKRLHPGLAARNGLTAAALAKRGFNGGSHILEAQDGGFLIAMSDSPPHPAEITQGLGTEWRAEGACFKPYAACGSNHASIDAVLTIKQEHQLAVSDIKHIRVGVAKVVTVQTGFEYRQSTVLNAQMSIRYNVAVALLDDAALLEQFTDERLRDPHLNELISRVDVYIDPEMDELYPRYYAGVVEIELTDGRILRKRVDASRGMPENPMPRKEILAKFHSLTSRASVGDSIENQLIHTLEGAFNMNDVGSLGRMPSESE